MKKTIGAILALPFAAATTQDVLQSVGAVIDVVVAALVIMIIYYAIKLAFMTEGAEVKVEQAGQPGWIAQLLGNNAKNWIANTLETSGAEDLSRGFRSMTGIYSLDDAKNDIEKSKDALTGLLNLMHTTLTELVDENKIKTWLNSIKTTQDTASPWNDATLDTGNLVNEFTTNVIKTTVSHTGYSFDKNEVEKVCKKIAGLTTNLAVEKVKNNKQAAAQIEALIKKIAEFSKHSANLVKYYSNIDDGLRTSGAAVVNSCNNAKDKLAKLKEDKRAEVITKALSGRVTTLSNNITAALNIIKKLD